MQKEVGKIATVLIEGNSKKSENDWAGRSDQNKMVIFPKEGDYKKGDYVRVLVERCTGGTLLGKLIL